ncbi:MAG: UDP-N-acetylmuramoyl-L-alanyl-D-glutamate--2,6-diaminopimelate ligase, partial [Candidatus Cloacimonetes bacterium]|nr:UDP-N-acetylmuramoyl-L-alanyl-D-glutamate--2,6-diaminopimelate ligase [Candidatus Cloacimonadota bacterium]
LHFNNPSSKFTLIGITGTNGKTTTSLIIWQILVSLGYKVGWIGTLGYQIESGIVPTKNTTPDIIELNEIFDTFVKSGCKYVVMEVSSHALSLDRVYGVEFDYAVFTNLSRDHLDFHKDMEDYYNSKVKLFEYTLLNKGMCLINNDDEYCSRLVKDLKETSSNNVKTLSETNGDIRLTDYVSDTENCSFNLKYQSNDSIFVKSDLIGHFNALNLAMALIIVKELIPDLTQKCIEGVCSNIKPIKGRLEKVENDKEVSVFIDFAHTPDALRNVLKTLKELPHNRLLVLFGAGGDRDKGKRPEMLETVLEYADAVIISDDNPRFENPNQIIRDIVSSTDLWTPWWIIRDRKIAIDSILNLALKGDIVLVAGKGHEDYQEICGIKYSFSDYEEVLAFFKNKVTYNADKLALPIDYLMLELLFEAKFVLDENHSEFNPVLYSRLSTDSRTISSNSVFYALLGENFDGHDYLESVLEDKSNCAVISNPFKNRNRTILCKSTQEALGRLAKKYLIMFPAYKIALTGSTGKTTTKEFLANIFAAKGKVLKTVANNNNIIGLSNTIFNIKPDDEFAIFELGTNHFGEIAQLSDICNPDTAIITNIGPSHLEFFYNEDGVYREKAELFKRKLQTRIFPCDDTRFIEYKDSGKSVGFSEDCSYWIQSVRNIKNGLELTINEKKWHVKETVPYLALNVSFAIACAKEYGLLDKDISNGLNKATELNMRMEIRQYSKATIMIDCYNANPVSMKAAINYWYSYQPNKKHIAVLGDMLELGEKAVEYHKSIGELLHNLEIDKLITVGNLSKHYHCIRNEEPQSTLNKHTHFPEIDDRLIKAFLALSNDDVLVLIKASHGIHLERLINELESDYQKYRVNVVEKQSGV